MTNFSVRKFFAAAVVAVCLPLLPHTASAASASNLPDFTDLVDKVSAGELSARAAGIQAGFIHEKTTFDKLMALWKKATAEEKEKFLAAVEDLVGLMSDMLMGKVTPLEANRLSAEIPRC